MSSLRKSCRVRPKSPPLQPPSASTAKIRAGIDAEECNRIGQCVSGMTNVRSISAAGGDGRERYLVRVRGRRWFPRARARFE
jgi:hypothetical protein